MTNWRRTLGWLTVPFLLANLLSCHGSSGAGSAASKNPVSYWVYFGTYTGPKSKGIYMAKLDVDTGALSAPQLAAEIPSPSFLAIHPSGRYLYAVNEVDSFDGTKTG